MSHEQASVLKEIMLVFLKLGTIAFGGPAAHIAMMEAELVRRRHWLKPEEFMDLLGASNLIPGPNSTELAIHIGYRRGGWQGLLVAGIAFILPACLIVLGCAWAYVKFNTVPHFQHLLYGIKPVIIAVVVQALWSLGRTALKTKTLALLGLAVALLNAMGVNEILLLFGAGGLMLLLKAWKGRIFVNETGTTLLGSSWLLGLQSPLQIELVASSSISLSGIFWLFAKVGSVLFGSGYVLLAFLRADLVVKLGWLSENQLLDAIAVGQFTPGPLFSAATFIGYLLAGPMGALLATVGIFLPAFVFVALSSPFIPKIRHSPWAGAFLDGVNAASLALMAVVTLLLTRSSIIDPLTLALALISGLLLFRYKLNSAFIVLGAGVLGVLIKTFWI